LQHARDARNHASRQPSSVITGRFLFRAKILAPKESPPETKTQLNMTSFNLKQIVAYKKYGRTALKSPLAVVSLFVYVIIFASVFAAGFSQALPPSPAQAAVTKLINFQGKLTNNNASGTNVANGTYSFEFKMYSASFGGGALWTETWDGSSGPCPQLVVTNGVFNAKLGSCNSAFPDFTGGSMYISVNFDPGTGYDGEMNPRKQIGATVYAIVANGVSGDGTVQNTIQSATALTVARSGTNYALQVDTNTASSATGLKVTSAAVGGGIALAAISSGTDENLTLNAKGAGTISINGAATGDVLLGGGSASTGCTVTNSTGALACSGSITGASTGTVGYWARSGTTLSPATSNDIISVSGNSGDIITIASSATGSANKALNVSQTGATSGTDYAVYLSNTGAATTNVGLYATASGGTNNYAAIFDAGSVGIGTTAPSETLDVSGTVRGIGHASFGNSAEVDGNYNNFANAGATAGAGVAASIALNNSEVLSSAPASPGVFLGLQNNLDFGSVTTPASEVISFAGGSNAVNIGSTGAGGTLVVRGQLNTVYRDNNQTGNLLVVDGVNTFVNLYGSDAATFVRGTYSEARIGATSSPHTFMSVTNLYGVSGHAWVDDEATVTNAIGVEAQASSHNTNGPNVTNLIAVRADADVPVHTDNAIGVQITASNGTAATNAYGIKIDGVAGLGANAWGIYENGTWPNYFGGNVGILDTTPAAAFTVGDGDLFQITSSGEIAAATGIASSGTITFSGFTSNGGPLYTNGSGVLAQTTAGSATQVLHGGTTPTFGAVALATDVSGTLPVGNGGTGATTFTSNGVLYGNSTSAIQVTAQGGANTVLVANAGAPSFSSAITVGTSVTSPIINATTALQLGGTDINTAGTLTNVAYLNQANVFTANQTIQNTAPQLTFSDSTASAKDLLVKTDGDKSYFQELAGSDGSLLTLDLANNKVGIGVASPLAGLDVQPSVTAASAVAYGARFQPTITASANSDVLSGVYINPTFNDNTMSDVIHYASNINLSFSGALSSLSLLEGERLSVTGSGAATGLSAISGHETQSTFSGSGVLNTLTGDSISVVISGAGSPQVSTTYGLQNQVLQNSASSTALTAYGSWNRVWANNGTMNTAAAGSFLLRKGSSGLIGTAKGIDISGWVTAGTPATISYGIYMDTSLDGFGSTSYALYSTATSSSYMAGNLGLGDASPAALLTVGNGDLFQVNSSGAIAAVVGITSSSNYVQSAGTFSLTSANTTQTTTSSAMALNLNSLTSGTGLYVASSTLSAGKLIDLQVSGTAAASNTQTVLNIATAGANATSTQTTYGAQIANTHTGTASTNVGLLVSATGGTAENTAIRTNGGNILQTTTTGPIRLGTVKPGGTLTNIGLAVSGKYAYAAENATNTVRVYDISVPTAPVSIGSLTDNTNLSGPFSIKVVGHYAYVTASGSSHRLTILDVSDPTTPVVAGTLSNSGFNGARGLYVSGKYAYIAAQTSDQLSVVNISNPAAPVLAGSLTDGTNLDSIDGLFVQGKYAYLTSTTTAAFIVVDVSNPAAPVYVATASDVTNMSTPHEIAVSGRYAYVASQGSNGLVVIDISDPNVPVVTGFVSDASLLDDAKHVVVAGNYAYVSDNAASAHRVTIVDISNPAAPTIVGTLQDATNLTSVRGIALVGKYLYAAFSTGLTVLDVTGIQAPSASLGNVAAQGLSADTADIYQNLNVGFGLNVGTGGILSGGAIAGKSLQIAGSYTLGAWGTSGVALQTTIATYTDSSTANSGTATNAVFNSFAQPTLAATHTSVTTTNASTVYIENAPAAGTNQAITNAYSLWVDAGSTRLDGSLILPSFTSNGGPLYTNGSGVVAQITAGTSTQVLHGGTTPSFGAVVLTTDVSGTLPVGNGGTGAASFTSNGVLYGNSTSAIQVTAAGTTGQCLTGNTGSAPTWGTCGGMSIGGTVTSGTTGSILFIGSSSALAQDNTNFFFDDSANRLGILDATPAAALTVGSGDLFQVNSSGAIAAVTGVTATGAVSILTTASPQMTVGYDSSNKYTAAITSAGAVTFDASGSSASFSFSDTVSSNGGQTNSEHFGAGSTVTGVQATAIGNIASASQQSTVIGYNASAAGTVSTVIGVNAVSPGAIATAIGAGASTTGQETVGIGYLATTTGNFGMAIGSNSSSVGNGLAIGYSATASGSSGVAIGRATVASGVGAFALGDSSVAAFNFSSALGFGATTTAARQFVVGSADTVSSFNVTEAYFGSGVVSTAPAAITMNASGGSGTDIAGANLQLAGGKGTGNAAGGNIVFQTSNAGSTGTTLQSLTTKATINVNGNVAFGQNVTSATTTIDIGGTGTANAVCHTTQTGTNDEGLVDCTSAPAADYAEMYPVTPDAQVGDIMATGTEMVNTYETIGNTVNWNIVKGKVTRLVKSTSAYQANVIGVVSDNYGDFISTGYNIKSGDNPKSIALTGRVLTKVTSENGFIKPGDFLTTSATVPGAAMRAYKGGAVIGQALAGYSGSGTGKILVFIKATNYNGAAIQDEMPGLVFDYVNEEQAAENSAAILIHLLGRLPQLDPNHLSQVHTDVVVAGAEIVTPTVTTHTLRADILTTATSAGGLSISSTVVFNGGLKVDSIGSIGTLLSIQSDVEFFGTPYFTADTAGFAIIKPGAQSVDIEFSHEYLAQPMVNATISFENSAGSNDPDEQEAKDAAIASTLNFLQAGVSYAVTNKTVKGFTIVLNKPAPEEIRFSWISLAVKNANTFSSIEVDPTPPQSAASTPPPAPPAGDEGSPAPPAGGEEDQGDQPEVTDSTGGSANPNDNGDDSPASTPDSPPAADSGSGDSNFPQT
jgi:hypothetical protein